MGEQRRDGFRAVTSSGMERAPPHEDEIEITLLGPGYGESVVLHIGKGTWVIVDSCINHDGNPQALDYLKSIGIDPKHAVKLIVATHWHDDHIRGMARVVEVCEEAKFCCASALCEREFLSIADALERRHLSAGGSGVRELHTVVSHLETKKCPPTFALANRLIYARDACEIWSLSPQDSDVWNFLKSIVKLFPGRGQTKIRVQAKAPNDVAVALWIGFDKTAVLLGSDLEKKGWVAILESEAPRPKVAAVFKVAHHGSTNAHEPEVWQRILEPEPFSVLTPWRRGQHALPTEEGVRLILSKTRNAFVTARNGEIPQGRKRRNQAVARTLRRSGIRLRGSLAESGAVRLRRPMDAGSQWSVEMAGPACHLTDLVA